MAMSRVLTCLRDSLERDGLSSIMRSSIFVHQVVDTSFVDDVAIPCLSSACDIASKTGRVASCAFCVFKLFGMTLNFKPGKSETIIGCFGPGSMLAKRELTLAGNLIPISAGSDCYLRVVSSYQHLGTCISISTNMCDEVTKRNGMMSAETARLCKSILRVPDIPIPKKIQVIQTYVMTKGTFQCGAWPELPDAQYKRLHSCILRIYRNASGNSFQYDTGSLDVAAMFNDDDIIHTYGFLCPRTILRMCRLLLFVRIVVKSPPFLLALSVAQVNFSRGWSCSLVRDLRWLCCSPQFSDAIGWSLQEWVDHIKVSPRAAANSIRNYCKSPFANICTQWAVSKVLQTFAQPIQCSCCGRISKSLQSHAVHMFRKHGIKCSFRRYVAQTHCMVCLREFWSRENCINHAKKSKVCRYNLILRGPLLSQDEADSLDQACRARNRELHASGRRRHFTDYKSSVRLEGPLQPILLLDAQVSRHHPLGIGHRHH